MAGSPMSRIAILGVFGALAMAMLLLMSLGGVSDSEAGGIAGTVHRQLQRSLDADKTTTKVTMRLDGKGVDGPRTYTLTLVPSAAVAPSESAVERLLMRAAGIVSGQLREKTARTTIHCVAKRGRLTDVERSFERVPGPSGRIDLLPLSRPPPEDAGVPDSPPKDTRAPAMPPKDESAKPAESKSAAPDDGATK